MSLMSRIINRLNHTHYYIEQHMVQGWPDPKFLYKCHYCSKSIVRREQPVNPIKPTLQEDYEHQVSMGNAAFVMRPPIGMEGEPKL